METVKITINGQELSVAKGYTILEAARENGIYIPTLCNIKKIDPRANCRICLVEIEGRLGLHPSCATKVSEGMIVNTNTERIRKSRKTSLELLLSRHAIDCHHCLRIGSSKCEDLDPSFCEMCFFCDCVKDEMCELQALAREYEVDLLPYEMEPNHFEEDQSLDTIIRNPNKCIKCRRCYDVCNTVQTVHNLSIMNRGPETKVVSAMNKLMAESPCVQCGHCVDVCPTGAVHMKVHKDQIIYYAHKYDTKTAALLSDNVLMKLAETFKVNEIGIKRIVSCLKKIGIDYVVDEKKAALMAEKQNAEILESKLGNEVIIYTDSMAAEKFIKVNFPELADKIVKGDSTQQVFGNYMKTTFAEEKGLDILKLYLYYVTNQSDLVEEAKENGCVNFVENSTELYRNLINTGGNPMKQVDTEFDELLPETEVTPWHELLKPMEWEIGTEVLEMEIAVDGKTVKSTVAKNLGQARTLMETIKAGTSPYQVIRVIA